MCFEYSRRAHDITCLAVVRRNPEQKTTRSVNARPSTEAFLLLHDPFNNNPDSFIFGKTVATQGRRCPLFIKRLYIAHRVTSFVGLRAWTHLMCVRAPIFKQFDRMFCDSREGLNDGQRSGRSAERFTKHRNRSECSAASRLTYSFLFNSWNFNGKFK